MSRPVSHPVRSWCDDCEETDDDNAATGDDPQEAAENHAERHAADDPSCVPDAANIYVRDDTGAVIRFEITVEMRPAFYAREIDRVSP